MRRKQTLRRETRRGKRTSLDKVFHLFRPLPSSTVSFLYVRALEKTTSLRHPVPKSVTKSYICGRLQRLDSFHMQQLEMWRSCCKSFLMMIILREGSRLHHFIYHNLTCFCTMLIRVTYNLDFALKHCRLEQTIHVSSSKYDKYPHRLEYRIDYASRWLPVGTSELKTCLLLLFVLSPSAQCVQCALNGDMSRVYYLVLRWTGLAH